MNHDQPDPETVAQRITEAEWRVMEALWDRSPRTAADLAADLCPASGWSERTVKTLVGRLVKKGAVSFEALGKRYLYAPRISRGECVMAEGKSFVERVFGGSTKPLLAHFAREGELSADDIRELRELLDDLERREGGR
ncbi:BlaI/MecI/CopY family transcriptional regulator [Engelhardtia mirabilis]|uniref:Penicillinase repressor n=1 Tax=Engelhardtia mirabilis TaxID=2528011 RepID=A0A518BS52_9BACT|nr:Penicillinase repressor [Planctomycetes bacterium Pla133]QDV04124.1 Penicillinase repressor [Planctomycetes bacterium Pla86]